MFQYQTTTYTKRMTANPQYRHQAVSVTRLLRWEGISKGISYHCATTENAEQTA